MVHLDFGGQKTGILWSSGGLQHVQYVAIVASGVLRPELAWNRLRSTNDRVLNQEKPRLFAGLFLVYNGT